MQLNDLVFTNIIFNSIGKINTGYLIIDMLCILIVIFYISESKFKDKITRFVDGHLKRFDKTNTLKYESTNNDFSTNFKSIMHWVSKNNDPSVKTLSEVINRKYNRKNDTYEDSKISNYRVDQLFEFKVDTDIKGKVYYRQKESNNFHGKTEYSEITFLEIYSKKNGLIELQNWVDKKNKEYDNYIKSKICDKQLLVEVSWDPKKKDLDIYTNQWESNATFDNRFFAKKDEIIEKINFFIKNPEWYKHRGIPYTLGILLWGEPGCGKTGFIKAMMNLTGRHGISIKLNNRFDMNKLRDIICDEEIYDDIIIPQKDRILIFEDIDCMGEIVKDRNKIDKKKDKESSSDNEDYVTPPIKKHDQKKSEESDKEMITKLIDDSDNNYNNNLSYFLNILDGIQECYGRIIIMTTNKPEQLDKALVRPGRIDFNINFNKASVEDIKNMLEFYWQKPVEELSSDLNEVYSHAHITNFSRTSKSLEETIQKITAKN